MTQPTPLPSVKDYVIDVAERAVRTFFQTLAAYFGAGALDLLHADWTHALDLSAGAAVLSIITSMAAAPFGEGGTASLTRAVVPRSLVARLRSRHATKLDRLDGWPGVLNDDTQEFPRVINRATYIRRPRTVASSYTGRQVAAAYGLDPKWTGKGFTGGIVELGGGFGTSDLRVYFAGLELPTPNVVAVTVAGGKNSSDGPGGADAEVLLDIEVAAAVAPGAAFRVYFAPNTDDGFLAAVERAVAECDAVSISWGGPENAWDPDTMDAFDQVFAAARKAGVPVFAAAGDTGSGDSGGRGNHVDFPASSPNVIGCGGTRLTLAPDGSRTAEVVWDDNDTSSATGGGVSAHFPGRDVPDVAGNADPVTGYEVLVDGERGVIGGTSAVAPLYLGMYLAVLGAVGGQRFDFLNTVVTNPQICFDVTSGDNGGFRAGPGRDRTTGFGVVDAGKLLEVLADPIPDPAPPAPTPEPPAPAPGPAPVPTGFPLAAWEAFEQHPYSRPKEKAAIAAVNAWLNGGGS